MSASDIQVTYAAAPSFLSSQWPTLRDGLLAQLPLRSIHWKPPSGPSVRTIQELGVKFVAFDTGQTAGTSQIPSNLVAKPLLNLYFVSCEDAESYRGTVGKQLKDWHAVATQRKNQEWVIVYIVRPDNQNAAAGFFQRGNILDKLRADFNTDKRDRCMQLAWPITQTNPAAWAELLSKIKDGILSSFDAAISQREEEVRRSEQQRLMPGWNFCTFFLLKESLAMSYESMTLVDDSLRQYEQLQTSFLHVVREKNLSWFGALIVPSPKDDSSPLLSVNRKPYQDLILANTISVFDLQIYMLAREAALLAKVNKLAEVCRKVHKFLVAFGRQLWDAENILPAYFIESWTYSSALSVVEQVNAWAENVQLEDKALGALNSGKAELVELARHQLDIMGVRIEHLPNRPPFSMTISPFRPTPNTLDKRASRTISQPQLMACLHDKGAFYDLYVDLTNKAIDLYAKAGRRKFALRLHGSLAALDLHRGSLDPALQTYSSLPAHYSPYKWTSLESYMLTRAIDIHSMAGGSKDAQWINLVLSFLKLYVDRMGRELLMPESDVLSYVTAIVDAMTGAVGRLDSDLIQPEHPMLSIRMPETTARLADTEDGCYLDVVVTNHLPCKLSVDEIRVRLTGRGAERLDFTAVVKSLAPGPTTVTVFCPTSSWGTYALDASEARLARLHFLWDHKPSLPTKARSRKVIPTLVRLLHSPRAVDVRVRKPHTIVIGARPDILLTVSSGRNHVEMLTIKLSSKSNVTMLCREARFDDDTDGWTLEKSDDSLTLADIPEETVLSILVPYTESLQAPSLHIDLSVAYTTQSHPAVERSLSLTSRVPTSLPVRVNVEDFFRGSRLFSKFTISTTSTQYIRLASAELKIKDGSSEGLSITKTNPRDTDIVTVTPTRPVNTLFALEADKNSEVDSLQLCIRYRMLRDEVETLLEETIDSVVTDESILKRHRAVLLKKLVEALESDPSWVEVYTVLGELHVPPVNEDGDVGALLATLIGALRSSGSVGMNNGTWREIYMPVDVPLMSVLASARLSITPPSLAKKPQVSPVIYAGQPVSALLSVHTKFGWGHASRAAEKTYRLRFDIEELVRDWLVSGRKRGDFEATDGATYTTRITLIPLHHGELPLPKILVSPLPLEGEMTMGSLSLPSCETHQVHGAEVALVLPRGGRSTFVVDMGEGLP